MKKILFPTDFSPGSNVALKYASRFCRLYNCELIILHACHINAFAYQLTEDEISEEKIIDTAGSDLFKYCNSHKALLSDIKLTQVVEYGLAADSIADAEKKYKADMIIMGTTGMKGLNEYFIGSNTTSVINKVSCPVLTIPENAKLKHFKKIVFATDYNKIDIDSIKFLINLVEAFKAEITILHITDFVVPSNYENALLELYKEDIRKSIDYKKLSFQVLKGINHSKALNEFVTTNNIDLIVVATRKKNLLTRLFDPSFTKRMLYHTHIPLLSIHPAKK